MNANVNVDEFEFDRSFYFEDVSKLDALFEVEDALFDAFENLDAKTLEVASKILDAIF